MKTVTISAKEYETLKTENNRLSQQNEWLIEQVRLAKHKQFGASSERMDTSQLHLFNEIETESNPNSVEPELIEIERHSRKKSKEHKDKFPTDLPVEVIEYTLDADEQSCPKCNGKLHVMGKEVKRRELKIIPAKAVIIEHVSYTYSCRCCEKNAVSVPIVKVPISKPVIKGSFAAPETIAHILTQKYVMGVPLYRQEQEWNRQGIEISRQTMANWAVKVAEDWLEPIYNELHKQLLAHDVLHADETTVQVLHESGKTAQSKSYMWLYRTSGYSQTPIVLYDYKPDRKSDRPMTFLKGFKGYLHADGYAGYHKLSPDITIVGCWAHARRKFDEALKSMNPKEVLGSSTLAGKNYCDKLFSIEKQLSSLSFEERYSKRQELARSFLDEFFVWLQTQRKTAANNSFGRAVSYTLDQQKYLEHYLLDGRLEISNNRAERSIKPFVIGRKNWLFSNTPKGAKASAIIYSIVETAKENSLNPYDYLTHIFKQAPNLNLHNLEHLNILMPHHFKNTAR